MASHHVHASVHAGVHAGRPFVTAGRETGPMCLRLSDRGHLNHDPMLAVAFALGAATGTAFVKGLSLISHRARGCAPRIERKGDGETRYSFSQLERC